MVWSKFQPEANSFEFFACVLASKRCHGFSTGAERRAGEVFRGFFARPKSGSKYVKCC